MENIEKNRQNIAKRMALEIFLENYSKYQLRLVFESNREVPILVCKEARNLVIPSNTQGWRYAELQQSFISNTGEKIKVRSE